ncbi:hypothetical protein [Levilactobacillus bambusae]|uniref:Uncharacterized protein n=1 Tax=Levilactobacillus bambusae TaxID=2024736 RepID=A0A2V1N0U9_9LACO|nr:hypothetical protein [Levilactobacillus bambusae]PWG00867.1 hypothetical protein DCM90_01430 [Levilactobacillus bambusae]
MKNTVWPIILVAVVLAVFLSGLLVFLESSFGVMAWTIGVAVVGVLSYSIDRVYDQWQQKKQQEAS